MSLAKIDNLEIFKITKDILLVHQIKASAIFTRCDGLIFLKKKGRNTQTVVLDLNIEPKYINKVYDIYGPVSDYVCTHTHMDHSAHVYVWERLGVNIYAPYPEHYNMMDSSKFLELFGFLEFIDKSIGKAFVRRMGFRKCEKVISFNPGDLLKFDNLEIETIRFPSHSIGHVGFLIPNERILHISCLGFDKFKPDIDGFGPWYGFRHCSIPQFFKDIDLAELIYQKRSDILTSSHSYIVRKPDYTPFNYMKKKIELNQKRVDQALMNLNPKPKNEEEAVNLLLKTDLFFPKKKMDDVLQKIYTLWEFWIIRKHIERSGFFL
ncbi:MAG: MBL fold metallo-hydrolase [Promethearchaeota archaeon]